MAAIKNEWERVSQNSFEKFTAKSLVTKMKQQNDPELKNYEVRASDRKYNIWLSDPLAVRIFSKEMAEEKLDYVHNNPLQSQWNLCKVPDEYRFSSAAFYLSGRNEFNLVTNIMNAF
jgi:putative transposase